MRYVIADRSGKSHAYFDRRVDARQALREMIKDEPDAIDEFYLAGFNESGVRVFGPQSARSALESLPVALVVRELRASMRRYLTGRLTLDSFRAALNDVTWGLSATDYAVALDLRAQVEQLVSASASESQLKANLAALAPSWWALEVADLVPQDALSFAGARS